MDDKDIAGEFEKRAEGYRKEFGKDKGDLVLAVEMNYADKVAELLNKGTGINFSVSPWHTLLCHHVCNLTMDAKKYAEDQGYANDRDRITELLLNAGANPNGRSTDRYTPLINACWGFKEGDPGGGWQDRHLWVLERIVKRLVKAGADPDLNQCDFHGRTLYSIFPRIKDLIWEAEGQKKLLWIIEDCKSSIVAMAKRLSPLFDAVLASDGMDNSCETEDGIVIHNPQDTAELISNGDFGKIVVLVDKCLSRGSGFDFVVKVMAEAETKAELCLVYNSGIETQTRIPVNAIRDAYGSDHTSLAQFYLEPLDLEGPLIEDLHRTISATVKTTDSPVAWVAGFHGNLLTPKKDFYGTETGVANYEVIRRTVVGLGKAKFPRCLQKTVTVGDLVGFAMGNPRRGGNSESRFSAAELIRTEIDAADVLQCEASLPDEIMMRAIDLCTQAYGAPDAGIAMLAGGEKALSDKVVARLAKELVRQRHTAGLHMLAERTDLTDTARQELFRNYGIQDKNNGEVLDASKLLKRPVSAKPKTTTSKRLLR